MISGDRYTNVHYKIFYQVQEDHSLIRSVSDNLPYSYTASLLKKRLIRNVFTFSNSGNSQSQSRMHSLVSILN